ncbi:MAG TPA: tetratricopeptide repeat protein [Phycisphaerae bacterium]|nr:tetratricopeptide repeat protein [Phycisphaerae bacterium]
MNFPFNSEPLTDGRRRGAPRQFALPARSSLVLLAALLGGCQIPSRMTFQNIFQSAEHHVQHGDQLLARGDLDGARKCFASAERCDPNNASALAGLGRVAEKQGQLEEAIAYHGAALKYAPENSTYALALADALRHLAATSLDRRKLLESAIRAYRHTLSLAPDNYVAALGLAQCYRQRGEFDRAVQTLRRAQKIDPSNPQAHTMLAAVYESSQHFDAAMEEYKLALKFDRDDPAVHNSLAALNLAMARSGRENAALARERAAAHCRRSLQLDPDQPSVRMVLAELQSTTEPLSAIDDATP